VFEEGTVKIMVVRGGLQRTGLGRNGGTSYREKRAATYRGQTHVGGVVSWPDHPDGAKGAVRGVIASNEVMNELRALSLTREPDSMSGSVRVSRSKKP
jgi:hypothetical protein